MDSLGDTLAALADYGIAVLGQPTSVNGVDVPGGALWSEAQPNRITTYLDQNDWGKIAYDVVLPVSVLRGDCCLASGSEVVRLRNAQRCVVRRVDVPGAGRTAVDVLALVVVAG